MRSDDNSAFILYFRENCHLCESMRLALMALQQQQADFSWVEIDIDGDKDLILQFDVLVPVLYFQGKEICHHFIDEQAISDQLRAM